MTSAKWRPWLWSAAIWYGFGVIEAVQQSVMMHGEGMHHPWGRLFVVGVMDWTPWFLATPLVMRLDERLPSNGWKKWAAHFVGAAVVGLLFCTWTTSLVHLFDPYGRKEPDDPFWSVVRHHYLEGFVSFLILYGAILAVNAVLESRARLLRQQAEAARLNEQLSKAQLDAVRRQIEPHFLFNTLNAVSALVREGRNDDAVHVVAELSEFLRRVLEESGRPQVPLAEEMEFTERYLEIQKVRFAERLKYALDVPADALQAKVPTLMVQMMVENAIKHGLEKRAQGGTIRVSATRVDDALILSVANDGPGLAEGWQAGKGIGLANLRARLESLYGSAFELRLENVEQGVEVSVRVPFEP